MKFVVIKEINFDPPQLKSLEAICTKKNERKKQKYLIIKNYKVVYRIECYIKKNITKLWKNSVNRYTVYRNLSF